jgi:hypothetical protein
MVDYNGELQAACMRNCKRLVWMVTQGVVMKGVCRVLKRCIQPKCKGKACIDRLYAHCRELVLRRCMQTIMIHYICLVWTDYNRCCMAHYNRCCMAHYKLDYAWLVRSDNKRTVCPVWRTVSGLYWR